MNANRTLTTIGGALLSASVAMAQYAPAAPPSPRALPAMVAPLAMQAPGPTPRPATAPRAALAAQDILDQVTPMPALAPMAVDVSDQVAQAMAAAKADFDFQYDMLDLQDKVYDKLGYAQEQLAYAQAKQPFNLFGKDLAFQSRVFTTGRGGEEGMYQNGLTAIDRHEYETALTEFNNVVARNGSKAEGALYWKAYVLNKLGKTSEAQAAIETLRKTYPSSRWLDDAKALELEVKQTKGPVSPDSETDEDIKVLALNGLMQSDPEKALPQLERILKESHTPRLKRQALVVLGQSSSPKAQALLEQAARGGNPDTQLRAIQYLAQRRNPNTPQILQEIYASTSDPAIKRVILESLGSAGARDRLVQIIKSEKDMPMRSVAFGSLGRTEGQPELWQIYQSETTVEGKVNVLNYMAGNGNIEKLTEVARTDKEPKVRQKAIQIIAQQQSGTPSTTLSALYASEQDEKVKQTIIDSLSNSRNCKPLVDVAKSEKDTKLKYRIVERLSSMTKSCQAANEYMTEILSR